MASNFANLAVITRPPDPLGYLWRAPCTANTDICGNSFVCTSDAARSVQEFRDACPAISCTASSKQPVTGLTDRIALSELRWRGHGQSNHHNVLESHLKCKYKSHLKLAGLLGSKSDYELLLNTSRLEVRQKAISKILALHSEDEVATNISLTVATLRLGPSFVLDGTLDHMICYRSSSMD